MDGSGASKSFAMLIFVQTGTNISEVTPLTRGFQAYFPGHAFISLLETWQ